MTATLRSSAAPRRRIVPRSMLTSASVALALAAGLVLSGMPGLNSDFEAAAAEVDAAGAPHPDGFAAIVARVKPAVVGVRVKMEERAQTRDLQPELPFPPNSPFYRFFRKFGTPDRTPAPKSVMALGSGFFVSGDGYVVTNYHVVENEINVEIATDAGKVYVAKVIGTDQRTDVALLKVEGNDFPYVRFAGNDAQIGDWVLAVGNPFGLGGTVTAGIVSARGRDLGDNPYDDFIQIDAPVNKGNSGGPTFNMEGEVIGVNTAIVSPSGGFIGIAFDIPADTVKAVVQQLKEKGHVTRGWIGVQIQPVTPEVAEALGLKSAEGALVAEPQAGSPAAKAGIKPGDVITSVNDEAVKDSRELAKKIAGIPPGTSVRLGIVHNGKSEALTVALGELPGQTAKTEERAPSETREQSALGLALAPASKVAGAGKEGVVVTEVDPTGRAAESGIEAGDIILDVNGHVVNSPADVRREVNDVRAQSKHVVLLRVKTGDATRFVAVPIG